MLTDKSADQRAFLVALIGAVGVKTIQLRSAEDDRDCSSDQRVCGLRRLPRLGSSRGAVPRTRLKLMSPRRWRTSVSFGWLKFMIGA
jgi:hypothetical protein